VLTSTGIWHISVRTSSGFEHIIVSREAARRHGFERKEPKRAKKITGPTAMKVQLEDDYNVSFPISAPYGGTLKIMAHGMESMEEFCGLLQSSLENWEMKLGKEDAGLLKLLRVTCQPTEEAVRLNKSKHYKTHSVSEGPDGGFLLMINRESRCG
jgi:hypothetical protein